MNIETIVSPDFGENTYICTENNETVIIDPGAAADAVKSKIQNLKSKIRYVLLTHGHYDHILAALAMNAPVYAHIDEKNLIESGALNLSAYVTGEEIVIKDVIYLNGKVSQMDGFAFYHTPGHTAGSMVIKTENALFTGDTLFYDTVGRTDVPTGDSKKLKHSLTVFDSFDRNIMCYPGHGSPFLLTDAYKYNYFLK